MFLLKENLQAGAMGLGDKLDESIECTDEWTTVAAVLRVSLSIWRLS